MTCEIFGRLLVFDQAEQDQLWQFRRGAFELVHALGRERRGPIRLREFEAPEVGARRKKLDAHAGALVRSVAKIDDAALLFFFGDGIDEDEFRSQIEGFLQVKQATVGIHHNGMAGFPEFAAVTAFSLCAHGDPRKHAGAAALGARLRFCRCGHKAIVHCEKE